MFKRDIFHLMIKLIPFQTKYFKYQQKTVVFPMTQKVQANSNIKSNDTKGTSKF